MEEYQFGGKIRGLNTMIVVGNICYLYMKTIEEFRSPNIIDNGPAGFIWFWKKKENDPRID